MSDVTPFPPHVGAEFLLWLWYRAEIGDASIQLRTGRIKLWLDDRMVFRTPSDEKPTVVLTASEGAKREALTSLHSGKVLSELRIAFQKDERDYYATLDTVLTVRNLQLPQVLSETLGEAVVDRLFLYDEFSQILRGAFSEFCALRKDTPKFGKALSAWTDVQSWP
jgi:hypothetical protein